MKKVVFAFLILMMPFAANAQWVGGFGYYNVSDEEGSVDIDLGAAALSVGYEFETDSNFTWMPEFRLGIGMGDDSVFGVDVEIESFWALAVRAIYEFESGVYIYGAPSYVNLEVEASSGGFSASDDEGEFGVGGGVGFQFSETVNGEVSYETYDGADVLGISLRILFE